MSTQDSFVGVYNVSQVIKEVGNHYEDIKLCNGRDVVICLGRTQAGKSTLYNSLVHGLHKWKESEEKSVLSPIRINDGFPVAPTGDSFFSETEYPRAYMLPGGKVFLDTRGFFDSRRDYCAEAAAAILTDMAIRISRSVKIVWLQPYPEFHEGGVTNLDQIGSVLNKVVYDGAPILFLFNKELMFQRASSDSSGRKLAEDVYYHEPEESEDIWPQFHELALREIKKRFDYIIETDGLKRKELLQSLKTVAKSIGCNDSVLSQYLPGYSHSEERMKYLAHFQEGFQAKRVLFVDPKFETSIACLRIAIEHLPPALGTGSVDPQNSVIKALNFTNYCDELVQFRATFNGMLKVFVHLMNGFHLTKDNPITEEVIIRKSQISQVIEKHSKKFKTIREMQKF